MLHSIKIVSRRTGLSPHVIRVWEKRYGAVTPLRSGTNRRLYSEEEVERLRLLRLATSAGHAIGNIARLPTARLQELLAHREENGHERSNRARSSSPRKGPDYVQESLKAIEHQDVHRLDGVLTRAAVGLGHHALLLQVVAPLTQRVGDLWRQGAMTAADEHFATAAIRTFLSSFGPPFALSANAPVLVVSTPAGQLHEMGALIVGALASDLGWRVIYLGASLPAAEIAGAASRSQARAVALSIVYPEDDPHLSEELESLRRCLPQQVQILVGGRAVPAYSEVLHRIGAIRCDDLEPLSSILDQLRSRSTPSLSAA